MNVSQHFNRSSIIIIYCTTPYPRENKPILLREGYFDSIIHPPMQNQELSMHSIAKCHVSTTNFSEESCFK